MGQDARKGDSVTLYGGALSQPTAGRRRSTVAQSHHVRRNLVPLLNHESLTFKEGADLDAVPTHDLLQDGNQHAESVVAEHGALRNGREVLIFRHADREAVTPIHMQHHTHLRPALSPVHAPVT